MSNTIFLFLLLLALFKPVQAQNFDAAKGYIFEQSYVQRLSATEANALLAGAADLARWRDYAWTQKHTETLAREVRRQGNSLIFQAKSKPPLSLKSYRYRGKNDAGDSQIFSYLQTLPLYHLVGVEFSHDEPHFLLIERSTLKVYFINSAEAGQ